MSENHYGRCKRTSLWHCILLAIAIIAYGYIRKSVHPGKKIKVSSEVTEREIDQLAI